MSSLTLFHFLNEDYWFTQVYHAKKLETGSKVAKKSQAFKLFKLVMANENQTVANKALISFFFNYFSKFKLLP